jgi:hypothetical protein
MLPGKSAQVRSTGQFVTISFESEAEPDDDWDDGTGWMGSLISLRADLLRGDFRCLYLGWLFSGIRQRNPPCWRLRDHAEV